MHLGCTIYINYLMEENKKNKEIDVVELTKKILSNRKSLSISVGISIIIGVIVALNTPKTYTTPVILAPEIASGGKGMSASLSDMASSFGIELGTKTSLDAIYPEIYPDIISSSDFIVSLFDVPVSQKNDTTIRTYKDHILKDTKVPFWDKPKGWILQLLSKPSNFGGKGHKINPFKLSKGEEELCKAIRGAIGCQVDKKTSVITISVKDQDPLVSAIIADTVRNRLQEYITDYKTKKSRKDLAYYQKLFKESKLEYLKAQRLYASYSDANEDLILTSLRVKQEDLENEMQLKYNAYQQIAIQLQNAEAKVQESTPAFTIIQRATMPNTASSTPRSMIVAFFALLGVMLDALWILYIQKAVSNKKQKKNNN